jgi:hypothetical protein
VRIENQSEFANNYGERPIDSNPNFPSVFGARPIKRAIQAQIENQLAKQSSKLVALAINVSPIIRVRRSGLSLLIFKWDAGLAARKVNRR